MTRVRFSTTHALFDTFPELAKKIGAGPNDQFPIDYLMDLVAQSKMEDAVTFCAYLLPRREAVWWACGCTRDLLGAISQARAAGLLAAETWVYEPDDDNRKAALDIGTNGDSNDPVTWLALGAGWAGGFLFANAQRQVAMPPYMTARAVRIAVFLSAMNLKPDQRPARLKPCIAEGVKLAESGLS